MASSGKNGKPGNATAFTVVFFCIVFAWTVLDQVTKGLFAGMEPDGVLAGPFAGVFDIRLVHNTGGAWGIFSGKPVGLGIFSLVVCAALTVYFFWQRNEVNALQTVGIGLIVAGGIGNAIDRFALSYVTDFIEFCFIEFPVFNIADIGVTCGFVLLFLGLVLAWRNESTE